MAGDDPFKKQLAEMGIDPSIADQDMQLAQVMLSSATEVRAQEEAQRKAAEEAERAREAERREAERKAEEKRQADALKAQGDFKLVKEPYVLLDVAIGAEAAIKQGAAASETLIDMLKSRLQPVDAPECKGGEPVLSERCEKVLHEIYENFKQEPDNEQILFPEGDHEEALENMGLTKDSIRMMEFDVFRQLCLTMVDADVLLLFRLFDAQGYDIWLEQRAYATICPAAHQNRPEGSLLVDKLTIEKVKEFIENSFCDVKKVVTQLEPYQVRLLSKTQDAATRAAKAPVVITAKKADEKPEEKKEEASD